MENLNSQMLLELLFLITATLLRQCIKVPGFITQYEVTAMKRDYTGTSSLKK